MHDLETALENHDFVTLRVIGDWWELDLTGADKQACVRALTERLKKVDFALELNYLPLEEAAALTSVAEAGGQIPVGSFVRQFGDVRQMGPGRLEREEPWLSPESPAEALWYRGFLYRGFDDADASGNLVEYFYIPEEFRHQFPSIPEQIVSKPEEQPSVGVVEAPQSYSTANTTAVDDVTTLLSFAQLGELNADNLDALGPYLFDASIERASLLLTLAEELELLRGGGGTSRPTRAAVDWLKRSREAQLTSLAEAWSASHWNELCRTPSVRCEGSGWENDPVLARTALLDALPRDGSWHSVSDLVEAIKADTPDFQRPEGNYDTWYIRDIEKDVYLKGFESWDLVEGRLLRFLLLGPMLWLGLVETGEGCFRLTDRALSWLSGKSGAEQEVRVPLVVQSDAVILVPFNASRYERFQVARVAVQRPLHGREQSEPFQYQLTPGSLSRARNEGIQPQRVLDFLQKSSGRAIPASVKRGVERWSENGLEGRLQPAVVLRVRDAAILDTLQTNARTRPFIGERLGDLAAVVQGGDWREFQRVTAQLGLLLDYAA